MHIHLVLVEWYEEKRSLWRPRHGWENKIKIYFMEVGCDPGKWTDILQDRDQLRAYVREQ